MLQIMLHMLHHREEGTRAGQHVEMGMEEGQGERVGEAEVTSLVVRDTGAHVCRFEAIVRSA